MNNLKAANFLVKGKRPYVTVGFAIVSGIIAVFTTGATTDAVVYINWASFIVFGLSLTTSLLQIISHLEIIEEGIKCERRLSSCIKLDHEAVRATLHQLLLADNEKTRRLLIICYGTGGYDGVISATYKGVYGANLSLDVLLCCPDDPTKCVKDDDKKLIQDLMKSNAVKNITFHKSKNLPPIRACVLYDKQDKPVWCCTQVYSYDKSYTGPGARFQDFFAITEHASINNEQVEDMERQIVKAFMRLMNWSNKQFKDNTFPTSAKPKRTRKKNSANATAGGA